MGAKGVMLAEEFKAFLKTCQGKILGRWKDLFFESLGEKSKNFFTKEVDQFQNPLGYRIEETFEGILKVICEDFNWEEADYYLTRLIQVRAIQEEKPSKALNLFFHLKQAIRESIGEEVIKKFGFNEFVKLEDRVNVLMLRAFDHFMHYRERLYKIRYEEWKRNNFLFLKRVGLIYDPLEGLVKQDPEEKQEDKYQ